MAKRKYTYGKGSSEWKNPGDYYINDKWKCYYTDTGSGQSGKFAVTKALRLSDEFKDNPDEVIRAMIAGNQAKRRREDGQMDEARSRSSRCHFRGREQHVAVRLEGRPPKADDVPTSEHARPPRPRLRRRAAVRG